MATYLIIGRRKWDIGLMIDFRKGRLIVRANTSLIEEGIALETIPPGTSGLRQGMVLVQKNWRDIYFVEEHEGWTDDQYFDHAEELMAIEGIRAP